MANEVTFSVRPWADEVAASDPRDEKVPAYTWSNARIWWDGKNPYTDAPTFNP